jgi:ubiquitin-like-conjugating enzyme ATG10
LLKRGSADGSLLTLEEIMDMSILRHHALPEIQVTPHALVQPDASFPLLSQGDHPTLGTPGWFIHPCGTACAIGELIGERKKAERMLGVDDDLLQWLETWFMMMENIVDL